MAAREGQSHAAQEARRHDWNRYICALFAPPREREALFALIAFHGEIVRAGEMVREPIMGEIRKQWWRDAVEAIYGGGTLPATPTVDALAAGITDFRLPRREIDELIDEPTSAALMALQLRVLADGNDPDAAAMEAGIRVATAWDDPEHAAQNLDAARALKDRVARRYHPALLWARIVGQRDAGRLRRQLAVGWGALRRRY
jgi:phytoene synthase